MAVPLVNGHLPESRDEVDGGEYGTSGSSNVSDALGHLLHVHLDFGVKSCPICNT